MRRREFITLLGGAAATWPMAARAQVIPIIGILGTDLAVVGQERLDIFRESLGESGFVEGRNVAFQYEVAKGDYNRLRELASGLVRRQVNVIFAPNSVAAEIAAKESTNSIPIVFSIGDDPVKFNLVESLNRPGANATGVSYFTWELGPKRLGIIHELVPGAVSFAGLVNPKNPLAESASTDLRAAVRTLGKQIDIFAASDSREIDAAFDIIGEKRPDALLVTPDPVFTTQRVQLVTLAARYSIPTIFGNRDFVTAGGLISYSTSFSEIYRLTGAFVARILKGERPADLPVIRSSKFELVINMKTAKSLGLTMAAGILAIADEVIE